MYEVTGLGDFSQEQRHIRHALIDGHRLPILRLERIRKSKESVGREKDKLHVLLINDFLRCRHRATRLRHKS